MKFFRSLDSVLKGLVNVCVVLAGIMTLLMVFVTSYGVIMRYFFRRPEPVSYEIATVLMLWSFLFALSFVEWRKEHISADIFTPLMPKGLVKALHRVVGPVLALIYTSILCWKGWSVAMYSYSIGERSMSVWQEPLFPIKVMIPIGYALFTLVVFHNLCHGIAAYGNPTGDEDGEKIKISAI
jgi:TRAP-type C4-dicarboxylate transport system permease small subunit